MAGEKPQKTISPETTATLERLEKATTAAGATIRTLREQVKTGMTQDEVNSVRTRMDLMAESLEAMAKDPEDPVPVEPPPVEPPTPGGAPKRK